MPRRSVGESCPKRFLRLNLRGQFRSRNGHLLARRQVLQSEGVGLHLVLTNDQDVDTDPLVFAIMNAVCGSPQLSVNCENSQP